MTAAIDYDNLQPLLMGKAREGERLPDGYFLPYQNDWISDTANAKLWDKSRRVGATYAESYAACRVRNISEQRRDYWFSSADESSAFEFSLYCQQWCKMMEAVVKCFTLELEGETEDGKKYKYNNYVIDFPNGSRINCLSSSPKRFRSKGGDVDLDEFDWHEKPGELLDAALPTTTWGYTVSIMTTRNGEGSEFDKLVKLARKIAAGEATAEELRTLNWSYHFTPITVAIQQGLAEKVYKLTHVNFEARRRFFFECRARCRNEDAFMQEYLCVPSATASVLIPYDLYHKCEAENILGSWGEGERFYGFDVGREKDPTVLWGAERVGDVLITREINRLVSMPYGLQKQVIADRLRHRKVVRCCGDASGIGDMLVEELQRELGSYKVEKVKFTAPVKDVMAGRAVGTMEDRRVRVPDDGRTRESFHKIRKTVTDAGNVRLDATRDEDGHADEFWAFALMLEAAHTEIGKPEIIIL